MVVFLFFWFAAAQSSDDLALLDIDPDFGGGSVSKDFRCPNERLKECEYVLQKRLAKMCQTEDVCKDELEFQLQALVPKGSDEKFTAASKQTFVKVLSVTVSDNCRRRSSSFLATVAAPSCAFDSLRSIDETQRNLSAIPSSDFVSPPIANKGSFANTRRWMSLLRAIDHLRRALSYCVDGSVCQSFLSSKLQTFQDLAVQFPKQMIVQSGVDAPANTITLIRGSSDILTFNNAEPPGVYRQSSRIQLFHDAMTKIFTASLSGSTSDLDVAIQEFLAPLKARRTLRSSFEGLKSIGDSLEACNWSRSCKTSVSRNSSRTRVDIMSGLKKDFEPFTYTGREKEEYERCIVDCLHVYDRYYYTYIALQTALINQLRALFTGSFMCTTDECRNRFNDLTNSTTIEARAITDVLNTLPAYSVAPVYAGFGLAFNALAILGAIAFVVLSLVYKTIRAQVLLTVSVVGVFVANVIRMAWWAVLLQSYHRSFDGEDAKRMQRFVQAPDVVVTLIYAIVVLVFLSQWMIAVLELVQGEKWSKTKRNVLLGVLIGLGAAEVVYGMTVVIWYAVAPPPYDPLQESIWSSDTISWDDILRKFPRLPVDHIAEVMSATNIALGTLLLVFCIVTIRFFHKEAQRTRVMAVVKFLCVVSVMLAAFAMQAVNSFTFRSQTMDPPPRYTFLINYALCEAMIAGSLLVYALLAVIATIPRRPRGHTNSSDSKELKSGTDESSRPLLDQQEETIPSKYDF